MYGNAKTDPPLIPVGIYCPHVSSHIPAQFYHDGKPLGLSPEELALLPDLYDRLAGDFARALVRRMQVERRIAFVTVAAAYSRLIGDGNRNFDHPEFARAESDGIPIPRNKELSRRELAERQQLVADTYHLPGLFRLHQLEHLNSPIIIAPHSMNAVRNGTPRNVDIDIVYDEAAPLAHLVGNQLEPQYKVGYNAVFNPGSDAFQGPFKDRLQRYSDHTLFLEVNEGIKNPQKALEDIADAVVRAICLSPQLRYWQ